MFTARGILKYDQKDGVKGTAKKEKKRKISCFAGEVREQTEKGKKTCREKKERRKNGEVSYRTLLLPARVIPRPGAVRSYIFSNKEIYS